jgi:putative transposase
MLKAFKYRLYPSESQKILIDKHIGCCRLVYNLALEVKQRAYAGARINISCFDLMKQLPDLKEGFPWLKEVNSQCLQQAISNLDTAYTNFFKGKANFPNFKNRRSMQSFRIPQRVEIDCEKLVIPKFKDGIRIELHRQHLGTIKQATISKAATGKYYASILCETGKGIPSKSPIKENTTIGIDLGLKSFLVTSDKLTFENPKHLKKAKSKLAFIQRQFSKHKGKRTKLKLAKLHEKVANQRKDFLHKASSQLIRDNQTVAMEDLNVRGIMKNHKLAGAVADVSWCMLGRMLEYKAEWYGKNIIKIGRFDPSSKTCSNCGSINKELTLSDREWTCQNCGVQHDRDINAAINIKNFALRNYLSGGPRLKNQKKLPTLVGVMISEHPKG